MREVPKHAAPKTKKFEIARSLLCASLASPLSSPTHKTRLQIPGATIPPSPLLDNKAHAGPHLDLRSHLGSARRPQRHAERLQNRFGRRVAKRARVIFEIMTLRRVISEHSNLREGKVVTPKPHRCLHLLIGDAIKLNSASNGQPSSSARIFSAADWAMVEKCALLRSEAAVVRSALTLSQHINNFLVQHLSVMLAVDCAFCSPCWALTGPKMVQNVPKNGQNFNRLLTG